MIQQQSQPRRVEIQQERFHVNEFPAAPRLFDEAPVQDRLAEWYFQFVTVLLRRPVGASLDDTGKVPTAELGEGVPADDTFLRGDRTFAQIPSGMVGVPVYIQPTQPADTGKFLWVQTGLSGGGFTLWFNTP